jgi:hypothetical protein
MNWAHLPEPGGIYGQNPKLIQRFEQLMVAEAKAERRKQRERDRQKGKTPHNVKNPGPPPT